MTDTPQSRARALAHRLLGSETWLCQPGSFHGKECDAITAHLASQEEERERLVNEVDTLKAELACVREDREYILSSMRGLTQVVEAQRKTRETEAAERDALRRDLEAMTDLANRLGTKEKPWTREVFAAYVIDRAHGWDESSGIYSALLEVAEKILEGEAEAAYWSGELDDIINARAALANDETAATKEST